MKFFVYSTSKATSRFAGYANAPFVDFFDDAVFNKGDVIPKEHVKSFEEADVLILNGTWGNDLRKDLYLEKDSNTNELILNSPHYLNDNGSIRYNVRSAIIDEINTQLVDMCRKSGKQIVVFESATISRAENNYKQSLEHTIKSKFRLALDSWIYGNGTWLNTEDFETIPTVNAPNLYDHTWKMNEDGYIYILTGLETDPTSTVRAYDFIDDSIRTIREHTDRRIVVKAHPGSNMINCYKEFEYDYHNVRVLRDSVPLNKLYRKMYCAVIDNSTSIFELIDAGIPTYCSSVNFGCNLGNVDLNTINNPYLATKEEVLSWTNEMCCTELPINVFNSDKSALDKVKNLVRRKRHDL